MPVVIFKFFNFSDHYEVLTGRRYRFIQQASAYKHR